MCCFSRPVAHVSETEIFARPVAGGRQILVYSMRVQAKEDLAMILPLPVPPRPTEDAVRFISLAGYPEFFGALASGFPIVTAPASRGGPISGSIPAPQPLKVHDVGDFEASFVPTAADFGRLDARFRLPAGVLDQLPAYADWGFAVFKLRDLGTGFFRRLVGRPRQIHPMAFELPLRDPSRLFFPTVHVHDGEVHAEADFSHTLYWQGAPDAPGHHTMASPPARHFFDVARGAGTVDGDAPVRRAVLVGRLPNRDTFVPLAA